MTDDRSPDDAEEIRRELGRLASGDTAPGGAGPPATRATEVAELTDVTDVAEERITQEGTVLPIDAAPFDGAVAGPPSWHTSRRRRWPRRVLLGAVLLVLAGVAYYAVCLYQVWDTGRSDQARPVDAIVVMGAAQYDGRPSPQLAARLDQVVRLWPQGYAPVVVVTGGNRPGDRFTEAEASAAYLTDRGVPADAILSESNGRTTYESMEGVAAILRSRGADSVLIVTDPYHALRSRMIAEELGLTAYVSPTTTSVVTGSASLRRHLREALGVALARPLGFERLRGLAG